MLGFTFEAVSIRLTGVRQDKPPKMVRVDYEISITTDEPGRRLAMLHENIRKFGTISNTVASGCVLAGNNRAKAILEAFHLRYTRRRRRQGCKGNRRTALQHMDCPAFSVKPQRRTHTNRAVNLRRLARSILPQRLAVAVVGFTAISRRFD